MGRPKKTPAPPAAEAATADSPEPIETDEQSPAGKNNHPHVGQSCRYTNAGGYVRAAIVEGVDADGYRLAVFDPIERCIRHEHGVKVEAISPVG